MLQLKYYYSILRYTLTDPCLDFNWSVPSCLACQSRCFSGAGGEGGSARQTRRLLELDSTYHEPINQLPYIRPLFIFHCDQITP